MIKGEAVYLMIMLVIWATAEALINPSGNFPLNDDFSYGRSVYNLVMEGKLQYDQWLSMTLLTQVLWGAAFCEVFGFSFDTLRLSVVVLGYLAGCGSYLISRELGRGKLFSLLVALVVLFNPYHFSLSNTFMTDVPFFTFSVWSCFFYLKAFYRGSWQLIVAGTFFGLAATFVRQTGMMLPLAFGIAWLIREKKDLKNTLVAIAPVAFTIMLFLLYSKLLDVSQGLPDGYGTFSKLFKRVGEEGFLEVSLYRIGILLTYLGWFFLPFLPLLLSQSRLTSLKIIRPAAWLWLLLPVVLIAYYLAWSKLPFGNILYNFGLGPKLLKDGQFFINISPSLPIWVWNIWKVVGMAGGLLLLVIFLVKLQPLRTELKPHNAAKVFALANILLYGAFLMLDLHFFDRYYFQLLPFLIIVLLPNSQPGTLHFGTMAKTTSWGLLAAMALFSILATHDYLSWNRARWAALDFLTIEKKIPANQIDGGFEFNGWHKPGPREYGTAKSWWWVDREDYVVMFGPLEGFTIMKGFAFERWLPPGVDSLYVFKKQQ